MEKDLNYAQKLNLAKYSMGGCIQSLEMAIDFSKRKFEIAQDVEELYRAKEMLEYAINQAKESLSKISFPDKEIKQRK